MAPDLGSVEWRETKRGWSPRIKVFVGRDPVTGKQTFLRAHLGEIVLPARPRKDGSGADVVPRTVATAIARALANLDRQARTMTPEAVTRSRRTMADLWEDYRELTLPRLSPDTRAGYVKSWKRFVEPRFGPVVVSELTSKQLDTLYRQLECHGKQRGPKRTEPCRHGEYGTPLGASQVRQAHVLIGSMLTAAAGFGDYGVTRQHVARDANPPSPDAGAKRRAPLPEIVAALWTEAAKRPFEEILFYRIAPLLGPRRHEVAVVRWTDVDWRRGELTFDEAQHTDENGVHSVGETKDHQDRTIALDSHTVEMLREWRRRCEQRAAIARTSLVPDAYIFSEDADGSGYVLRNTWTGRFRRLRDRVPGAEKVRLYDLRHYVGTEASDRGAPITDVKDVLGHSRLTTTDRYAKGRVGRSREIVEMLASGLDALTGRDENSGEDEVA